SILTSKSNTGDLDINYTLYRNDSSQPVNFSTTNGTAPSGEIRQIGAGAYQYIFNSTGGGNWTSNASGVTLNINVSKGLLLFSISGNNITYPTSVNIIPSKSNTGDTD